MYQSQFKQPLYEWTSRDNSEYVLFEKYANLFLQDKLDEFGIPQAIKDKFNFIKDMAIQTGFKIKDLFKLFLNKSIFKLFTLLGWSITYLVDLLKKGLDAYKHLQDVIAEFVHKNKIIQWGAEQLKALDEFLAKHPKTKKLVGVAVAGLLLYIFFAGASTGHLGEDFDLSLVFMAFKGHVTLYEVFGTPSGTKLLMLFATGSLMGLGVTYPLANVPKLIVAVIITLAKHFKEKISKGNDIDQVTETKYYRRKFNEI